MKFRYRYPECNAKVKLSKMVPKYGLIFFDNRWLEICFIIELEPSKLVGRAIAQCSISSRFFVMKYAVVLAHEATENLK